MTENIELDRSPLINLVHRDYLEVTEPFDTAQPRLSDKQPVPRYYQRHREVDVTYSETRHRHAGDSQIRAT